MQSFIYSGIMPGFACRLPVGDDLKVPVYDLRYLLYIEFNLSTRLDLQVPYSFVP